MESDESIDFVDSEAVNAYGSVVAKEEHENPCEHFEEGENVDPPHIHPFINFFEIEFCHPCCPEESLRSMCPCKAEKCMLDFFFTNCSDLYVEMPIKGGDKWAHHVYFIVASK